MSTVIHRRWNAAPLNPLALSALLLIAAQWRTITVYDVLNEDCRFTVGNNDVGNAYGDM